jgi:leucyl-tRNA synthetase
MASELLETVFDKSLEHCAWPTYDKTLALDNEVTLAIQVNGKLRGNIIASRGATQDQVQPQAQALIEKWLEQKEIIKVVFVQDRLISFVVK